MAKIDEQKIIIKLSKLVRDDEPSNTGVLDDSNLALLLEALATMVGPSVMIELE